MVIPHGEDAAVGTVYSVIETVAAGELTRAVIKMREIAARSERDMTSSRAVA
jgi:hypothetical protein